MTAPTTPRDPFTDEDVRKALDTYWGDDDDPTNFATEQMRAALHAGTERLRAQGPSLRDAKRDDRPHFGCWAPGNYMNKCTACKCTFVGDKRAMHCADCAYAFKAGMEFGDKRTWNEGVEAAAKLHDDDADYFKQMVDKRRRENDVIGAEEYDRLAAIALGDAARIRALKRPEAP